MRAATFSIAFAVLCTVDAFASIEERPLVGFNPEAQYVSVSGEHAFMPPRSSDFRGPCPGLNAMANHDYIPRNGFVSIEQVVQGMGDAYGMQIDFAYFLAVLAAVQTGDAESFSIGGPPPPNLIAGGLLGRPLGISWSHNRFEGDASITRDDLYITGNAYTMHLDLFKGLVDSVAGQQNPDFNLDVMGDWATVRYNYSLYHNPYFFRGPVSFFVPPATNGLVAHLFSNKSADHPTGFLSTDTLKSFFGVSGPNDDLSFKSGYERIPENWYKWAPENEYTIANFAADVASVYIAHPNTIVFGGNTGEVNTMTPVDVADMSGGLYNAQTLLQGNNLACFMFQATAADTPDLLTNGGVIGDITAAVAKVNNALENVLGPLGCPQLAEFDSSQLGTYPGYAKLQKDGTY